MDNMRVDKFLKVSRILKRRSLAQEAASGGRVKVNGRVVKPSYQLKIGDIVEIGFNSGTFSFEVLDKPSNLVSDLLNSEYDVAVRGGWHCAPLIHNALNTNQEGLVRVSLAPQNTTREIDYFKKSLLNIIKV